MSVDIEARMVHVRYFGDHTFGIVPESECYFISVERPGSDQNITDSAYELKVLELKKYKDALIDTHKVCGIRENNVAFTVEDFNSNQKRMIHEDSTTSNDESGTKETEDKKEERKEEERKEEESQQPPEKKRCLDNEAKLREERENARKYR